MAVYVNTNVASLNSQRNLSNATNDLQTSFQRLSSGKRINSAADDAAGLQIGSRLEAQVGGLNQASRNANDGISLAQTAEGALDETTNMLQRMRVLSIQSANGSNSDADRNALQSEFNELQTEITRVSTDTTFGGKKLLDGSYDEEIQVGADSNQVIALKMTSGMDSTTLGVGSAAANISTAAGAQASIDLLDTAIQSVTGTRADLGAKQNRFSSTIRNISNISENVSASKSRIVDTDFAAESAKMAQTQVQQQAASSMLSQANQTSQVALSLL
ncbi:flagellin [Moritella sp. Urea-trap-13]|uniref:flagellin N-terminal helical domain-containing protein n=1 Tax=Moritella sp. Urea-trap-13 TaxID=2058327 RepID=UPI000C32474F|nr:flagellin [Moritella sp. Urea-trap-13]PKH09545.1 flagellin FliC [Moritella sp. Urea-trap-13]